MIPSFAPAPTSCVGKRWAISHTIVALATTTKPKSANRCRSQKRCRSCRVARFLAVQPSKRRSDTYTTQTARTKTVASAAANLPPLAGAKSAAQTKATIGASALRTFHHSHHGIVRGLPESTRTGAAEGHRQRSPLRARLGNESVWRTSPPASKEEPATGIPEHAPLPRNLLAAIRVDYLTREGPRWFSILK